MIIAMLDATTNDVPSDQVEVKSYPTLVFFTADGQGVCLRQLSAGRNCIDRNPACLSGNLPPPLLIIDKGAVAPNRPDFRGKRNPKSIRVDAAIAAGKFCAPFFLWINKDGKMEEECMNFVYNEI